MISMMFLYKMMHFKHVHLNFLLKENLFKTVKYTLRKDYAKQDNNDPLIPELIFI